MENQTGKTIKYAGTDNGLVFFSTNSMNSIEMKA